MVHRIFIGFEKTAAAAFWIQRRSILETWHAAAEPPEIIPIVRQGLLLSGVHKRQLDSLASTEFTYTRFLVPYLTGYEGWALFMDGDMMARADLSELFVLADPRYAAMVVKHDHKPTEQVKMDGRVQTTYPRKNWSSLVLWNCGHSAARVLSPHQVDMAPADWLHQFKWIPDGEIGSLPVEWNWLVGWSDDTIEPKVVHFTRGIPFIHDGFAGEPYAEDYLALARRTFGPHGDRHG